MSKLTRAEIIVTHLKEQGVDTIFGYLGGAILSIYDALYQHRGKITHILTPRKQGTSHAADDYARATGKVGVRLATSGPGTTNLVTGIVTVYMDPVPVVAITRNVTNNLLGRDSFQRIDITGVTVPTTKYNFIIKDVSRLVAAIRRAFTIAQTGHPSPVLVDITKGVTTALCEHEKQVPKEVVRQNNTITEQDVDRAVKMIRKAAKPLIFVDGGAVLFDVSDELRTFAHKIQAPVAGSLMGKGVFNGTGELYTGMMGMHGTKTFNFGITETDLLIVAGARFSDRVTGDTSKFAKNTETLQLDVNPAEINKNIKVDASIIGDVEVTLCKLNARLDPVSHGEWIAHTERMEDMYPLRYDKSVLTGPFIIQTINEVTGGDTVIVAEAGRHQMRAAQYYQYRQPRTLLIPGGLGTVGYGLGVTIGTKMGCRDKTVINIIGDGCFRMGMSEIITATRYNIPAMEVIVNSYVLGMIRQWQTLFYGKRYPQTMLNDLADSVKIAGVMGAKAYRVTQEEELRPVLRETIPLNIPVATDCRISYDDKIFPMMSPGAPIADTFDDMDLKIN